MSVIDPFCGPTLTSLYAIFIQKQTRYDIATQKLNDEEFAMKFQEIVLHEDQLSEITKYEKSFGSKWVQDSISQGQAREYCKRFLVDKVNKSWNAGNCYHKGEQLWERADGKPLTVDDIEALEELDDGQSNSVNGKAGDMSAHRLWECDSGD